MPHDLTGSLVVWEDGTRVDIHAHYTEMPHSGGGGIRGNVKGFTNASRLRLIKQLTTIEETAIRNSLFITLTYHQNEIPHEKLKKDLKHFIQRMRRNYPNDSGFWRLEFQQRGAPHYHLLYFGPGGKKRFIPYARLAVWWNRIAEYGNLMHLDAGTSIERCSRARSVAGYLSKYIGKASMEEQDIQGFGRYWGVIQRANLPTSKTRVIPLTGTTARDAIREQLRDKPGAGDHCRRASKFTGSAAESRKYTGRILNLHAS